MRRGLITATALSVLSLGLGWAGASPDRHTPDPPANSDCSPGPSGTPPTPRSQPPASLSPSTHNVTLAVGQSANVPLRVFQPAQELDAFFLEDNGTKSEFTHCAFQGGLLWAASRLAADRNFRVGLGNYGDYTGYETVPGDTAFNLAPGLEGVYLLDSPIRRPDAAFFSDVIDLGNAWEGGWNATSGDQANLEALYQVITGAGQSLAPSDPDNIPVGADAGFRPGAFPVIVMLAAEWFNTPSRTPGYPGADFAPVTAALHSRGVNLVGVWLDNTNNKEANGGARYDGLADLRDVVRSSGTRTGSPLRCGPYQEARAGSLPLCVFAPPADMNSNPGGSAAPAQLGPMLRSLVDSLANRQPVSAELLNGGGVATGLSRADPRRVDILTSHTFDASVTVRCPARLLDHTNRVTLAERVGGTQVATTTLDVTCRRPGKAAPLAFLAGATAAAFAAVDPPAQAPPTQLQPNPQVNPNPAANTNPSGVAAQQEQDEAQLAFVYREPQLGTGDTLAMSRRTDPRAEDALFAGTALAMFGAATVIAVRRRRATSPAGTRSPGR